MDKNSFIGSIKLQAEKGMGRGILPSLTIAQAILESGWGGSGLTKQANNLFGIKADSSWQGEYVTMPTTEYINGKAVQMQAKFRKYSNLEESIADHVNFLLNNSRYSNLIYEYSYASACKKIQQDGYATDPNYSNLLLNIINQNKLYMCDLAIETNGVIKIGETSTRVKVLQSFLTANGIGCKIDGVFGQYTQACVKAFQMRNNIESDGIVGLVTMSKF